MMKLSTVLLLTTVGMYAACSKSIVQQPNNGGVLADPSNLNVQVEGTKVNFSWTKDPLADGYFLQLAEGTSFGKVVYSSDTIQNEQYAFADLKPKTDYTLRIRAIDQDNPAFTSRSIYKSFQTGAVAVEQVYAFPGAEGFARQITGGRGGKVIKVTNLQDSGPGSLRDALNQTGPRIVVFEVSGNITLKSNLDIKNGDLTIAGQSAPGDGICLQDYPVSIKADNIVIRFLRFRMGDRQQVEGDAVGGFERKNILVDHCSMSWSTDECASFYNNENFTMQWCIIAESLRLSAHAKGAHGYGAIWGGKKATFHHNLIAHHDSRNPRLGEREGTSYALTDLVDIRNNVFYNWASNSGYGGEAMNVNMVNNYYKPGPATRSGVRGRIVSIDKYEKNEASPIYNVWGKFYVHGNVIEGNEQVNADNWSYGVANQFNAKYGILDQATLSAIRLSAALPIEDNVETELAEQAYQAVLEKVGASLVRDDADVRIINTVKNGNFTADGSSGDERSRNGIIDSQDDVGGWPQLKQGTIPKDSDEDGMPDAWEIANKLDPTKANANGRDLSKGYDNIEVYLNSLVKHLY
ncbi:fibronectin type III domain-containing protein [Sphingobacterium thalpophilum]|uniref:Fibronectin type III domain-containing protein n=1 Tax=Sphingobacterium thalpophilum TaxID=259 RepID=A0A4U9V145_9SPHI|nr:fibronectin type III domain-containing protein [Sphingobacterium thalpophilum]VTR39373.1 Uncharacterised protein [Sphingobacterium thalpophilum]